MNDIFTHLLDMIEIAVQAIGSPIHVHSYPKGHPRYSAPGITLTWEHHESDQGDRVSVVLSRIPTAEGTPDEPNGFRLYPIGEDDAVHGTQEYYSPHDAVARAIGWMAERQIRSALADYESWRLQGQQTSLNNNEE